jgi:hypothetical protein
MRSSLAFENFEATPKNGFTSAASNPVILTKKTI